MNHEIIISAAGQQSQDLALCEVSPKDQKWDWHKQNTQTISGLFGEEDKYQNLAKRLSFCALLLSFRAEPREDTGEIKLALQNAMFCKVRHCPICGWRRAMRNIARFYERMPSVLDAYPKASWLFLTLTVQNPEMCDLRATLQDMNKAFKRMIELQSWPALGYIRTTEITRSDDGKPHPHFHCLLLVPHSYFQGGVYLSAQAWSDIWRKCLRADYQPVIDIRKVKAESEKAKELEKTEGKIAGLKAAVLETLKYATKVEDLMSDVKFLYGITEQLHKLRFLATGGVLKDFLSDDVSEEEMIKPGGEEEETDVSEDAPLVLFSYRKKERKYRKVSQK